MFYQCNWTAWLQRAVLRRLSDRYIVPNAISLCPSLTFLFLSTFYSPACCRFSLFWDSSCVLLPVRASSYTVLSPSFSFLLSCLLMGGVLDVLLVGKLCTVGHKGMKIFLRAAKFTRLTCIENTCLQKLWHPPRPTSSVSSKYQISSLRRTSRQV